MIPMERPSRETAIKWYNYFTDVTLKDYIKKYGQVKWLTMQDITTKPLIDWAGKNSDEYVIEYSKDKEALAQDILDKGTYSPIYINSNLMVNMGFHRVESLKMINTDKKFLCVVVNDKHFIDFDLPPEESMLMTINVNNPLPLNEPFYFDIPTCLYLQPESSHMEYLIYKINKKKIEKAYNDGKESFTLVAKNYRDLYSAIRLIPHWVKDGFYPDDKTNPVKPRKCMNNYNEYIKWMEE